MIEEGKWCLAFSWRRQMLNFHYCQQECVFKRFQSKSCSFTCHIALRDKFCSCQGWMISISEMAAWWQAQKRMRNKSTPSLFWSLFTWCLLVMPLGQKAFYFWYRASGWRLRAGRFKMWCCSLIFWLSGDTFTLLMESNALAGGFSMHGSV